MFTPAMSASSRSAPCVSRANASATQVLGPPFLNLLPLADAITIGFAREAAGGRASARARCVAPSAAPTAALVFAKSRRVNPRRMAPPPSTINSRVVEEKRRARAQETSHARQILVLELEVKA